MLFELLFTHLSLVQDSGFPETHVKSFRILMEQLNSYASLKHHVKIGEEEKDIIVPMGREDALFVVLNTTTILNVLLRKLNRLNNL